MNLIPLFIALPLGAAFLLPILRYRNFDKQKTGQANPAVILGKWSKRTPDIVANLINLTLLVLSLMVINRGMLVYKMGGWEPFKGIPIGIYLVLDGLSVLMLLIINSIGFLAALYSVNYMEKYTDKTRYYTLFLLLIAGMNGVVLSGDMFNLFVFLEVAAIASYALVAFGTEAEELEAAFKYQVMGTVASGFILLGIALLYSFSGTLNMADIARIINQQGIQGTVLFVGALFIMGFGLKAAIMPFHAWLPDAHPSAPAPVSAMLSGVLIKAIGVYALVRILFNVLGLGETKSILYILMVLGIISMVAGALLALGQRDFKRLLAYSSISQIGYIVFAFGLGTPLGFLGGLFHLLNHATFKSLLFLNSGAIVYATENRDLEKMGGLLERMPVTGTTATIASMSIAGVPPLSGFWSKLIIIMAAIQAEQFIFALIAVLISIITLAYYLKVQRLAFFGKLGQAWKKTKEVPGLMCASMIILSLLCLGLGILLLPGIKSMILDPAVEVLKNGAQYANLILGE
ncbi:MAG TPA: NADH/ubiquinone/plastoquinone (complex I) [bacterium]|nr:NADH/ubiquinone/plastoquinone (complex I) [bacterium]